MAGDHDLEFIDIVKMRARRPVPVRARSEGLKFSRACRRLEVALHVMQCDEAS